MELTAPSSACETNVLHEPALAHLQRLALSWFMPGQEAAQLSLAVPIWQSLRHLRLEVCEQAVHVARFAPISQLQSLTSLELELHRGDKMALANQLLEQIRPPNLVHLSLEIAQFAPGGFRVLASAPFNQLRSLLLQWSCARSCRATALPTTDDYAAVFSAMHALHTIELNAVADVDTLLSQLHRAPALRTLLLAGSWSASLNCPVRHPSAPQLQELMVAAPLLRARLRCENQDHEAILAERALLADPAAACVTSFDRIHALLCLPHVEFDDALRHA